MPINIQLFKFYWFHEKTMFHMNVNHRLTPYSSDMPDKHFRGDSECFICNLVIYWIRAISSMKIMNKVWTLKAYSNNQTLLYVHNNTKCILGAIKSISTLANWSIFFLTSFIIISTFNIVQHADKYTKYTKGNRNTKEILNSKYY